MKHRKLGKFLAMYKPKGLLRLFRVGVKTIITEYLLVEGRYIGFFHFMHDLEAILDRGQ